MLRYAKIKRRLAVAAVGGVLLLSFVAGCARSDENAQVIIGVDSVVTVSPIQSSTRLIPTGDAVFNKLVTIDFDLSNTDAFGRATDEEGEGYGGSNTYEFGAQIRNSSNDVRLPALGGTGTVAVNPNHGSGGCVLGDASYGGGTHTDFWCGMLGLTPNTVHTLVYIRYSLTINGSLDTPEMLIFGTVAAPDALVPLDGTPGGYPLDVCNYNFGSAGGTTGVTGTQNPFVQGTQTTNAAGEIDFDCVINYNGLWDDFDVSPNTVPMGSNQLQAFALPRYNYIEVYEGQGTPANPVPAGAPVARIQSGVDLDATGQPIANSFAPWPAAGLGDDVGLADAATSIPDSIYFEYENLQMLESPSVYKLWGLFDDGSTQALDFLYRAINSAGDTVISPSVVSSFAGGPYVNELEADYPGDTTETVQFFLTVSDAAGATSPASTQPLWVEETTPGIFPVGTSKSIDLPPILFGVFDLGGSDMREVNMTGLGKGGLFGVEYRYDYTSLRRPPVGYQYVGWLVGPDSIKRLPDASYTTPPRQYTELTTVDTDPALSDLVTVNEILASMSRVCVVKLDASGNQMQSSVTDPACQGPYDLSFYTTFILALEPKAGVDDAVGPTEVFTGVVPQ